MLTKYLRLIWEYRTIPDNFYGLRLSVGQYFDLSYAEMEKLIKYGEGEYTGNYKEYTVGNAISIYESKMCGIRIGDCLNRITETMGRPFARRSSRQAQVTVTQLLYKNYLVDEQYPCTVLLHLKNGKLNYAAFDFPGTIPSRDHIDPRFLALFDNDTLFKMLRIEGTIVQSRVLDLIDYNLHLFIDHDHQLKVRLLLLPYTLLFT